jgi:hypothetical protein
MRQTPAYARATQNSETGSSYNCCVKIGRSARKHGIVDADIEHAMEYAMTLGRMPSMALNEYLKVA